MPKVASKLIALAAIGAVAGGSYLFFHASPDEGASNARKAVNQIWVERLPRNERDMFGHFVLVRHSRGRVGIVGRASQWRALEEGFKWGLERNTLRTFFPQDRVKMELGIKTWRCAGEAPEPFELCLELTSGQRSAKFYSMDEWVIEPGNQDSLDALADETPQLRGVIEQLPATADDDDDDDDDNDNDDVDSEDYMSVDWQAALNF